MSHQSDLIAEDINAYLDQHERKELLRFLTCGSVDDGKSTLIGRLLHDSKMIFEDQLAAVQSDSAKHGTTGEKLDLALLVDGLAAEREQGITIDVAYRYFSTDKRKFIIADTPGHEQYTRNMATGASTCDLAIILIDARHGVMTQTRRHSYIASLLGIKHIVVAINKMDLVAFSQERFEEIKAEYLPFAEELGLKDIQFVPISALDGDNVVNVSEHTGWYTGKTLMQILETVEIAHDKNTTDFRFPVQYVNRPNLDFRGFCGTVASGVINVGDAIKTLPSGKTSKVKRIVTFDGDLPYAFVGQAVTLTLEDEIDISRGDMIVLADDKVALTNHLQAHVVWMSEQAMKPGKQYLVKFSSKATTGHFEKVEYRIDVNTQAHSAAEALELNDIAVCDLALSSDVALDPYKINRATGAFIVIDRLSNITVGAGMVINALAEAEVTLDSSDVSEFEIELNALIRKHFPHWQALDVTKLIK
ncbi:sulfate adenylyltransferase subunit CysN [Halioxenophilus sp. WMMB6]|uniref:sulfate adenylyltransferase subunit CysN n=1 Tax=Halioxenophilus sp. WMMB6 TaxID=3073815 RepID=UPI00295E5705|nr:sulfate adenylyltransferase subunit CysN [Halioxenophilus sp. WMMB6]